MIAFVIMAAGKGTRMNSDLPKVLHRIDGKPMIEHVLATARALAPDRLIVVVGHRRDMVKAALRDWDIEFAVQDPQLGTGHAVMQACPLLNNFDGEVVILSGDVPLLKANTLKQLIAEHRAHSADVTVLSTIAPNPNGYGRIVRDSRGLFVRIVEEREADEEERSVREINSGIYCFNVPGLLSGLPRLSADNSKGEFYLTDVIEILARDGKSIQAVDIADFWEVCGINTVDELKAAESALNRA